MEIKFISWLVLGVVAIFMACSSDNSNENGNENNKETINESLVLKIDSVESFSVTDNKDIGGAYFNSAKNPVPAVSTGIKAGSFSGVGVFISFSGKATREFDITTGDAMFSYVESETKAYIASQDFASLNSDVKGKITISEYGEVGEAIKGSINISAIIFENDNPTANVAAITGDFTVKRESDDSML